MMGSATEPGRAYVVFLWSAWIVVAVGIFMLLVLNPWTQHLAYVQSAGNSLRWLGGVLGAIGAPASIILWFGMAAHCAFRNRSPFPTRLAWFALLFLTAMFGAAIYFFTTYVKQAQGQAVTAGR